MRVLCAFLCIVVIISKLDAQTRPIIFSDWSPDEEKDISRYRILSNVWQSPDKSYEIKYLRKNIDYDEFILEGVNTKSGKINLLGFGSRSVTVQWISTDEGSLAVLQDEYEIGVNDLYIVKPSKSEWALIYKSPNRPALQSIDWHIGKFDRRTGSLTCKCIWCETDGKTVNEATYVLPLYYAFHRK